MDRPSLRFCDRIPPRLRTLRREVDRRHRADCAGIGRFRPVSLPSEFGPFCTRPIPVECETAQRQLARTRASAASVHISCRRQSSDFGLFSRATARDMQGFILSAVLAPRSRLHLHREREEFRYAGDLGRRHFDYTRLRRRSGEYSTGARTDRHRLR